MNPEHLKTIVDLAEMHMRSDDPTIAGLGAVLKQTVMALDEAMRTVVKSLDTAKSAQVLLGVLEQKLARAASQRDRLLATREALARAAKSIEAEWGEEFAEQEALAVFDAVTKELT